MKIDGPGEGRPHPGSQGAVAPGPPESYVNVRWAAASFKMPPELRGMLQKMVVLAEQAGRVRQKLCPPSRSDWPVGQVLPGLGNAPESLRLQLTAALQDRFQGALEARRRAASEEALYVHAERQHRLARAKWQAGLISDEEYHRVRKRLGEVSKEVQRSRAAAVQEWWKLRHLWRLSCPGRE